jgi:pilus assembly protein Flp/PilA
MQAIRNFFSRNEEGATAVEYGIMVALIAAVIVGIVAVLGGQIRDAFQTTSDCIEDGEACADE